MLVPVAPGGHPAACGPRGYLLAVFVPGSHFAENLRPCHNRRNGGSCHFNGRYCRGDNRPLAYIRHPGGNLLSVGSHNRDG